MAETRTDTQAAGVETERGAVKRRGLIAGAAALVAGLAAKGMSESTRVAAADGNPIVIGAADNSGTVVTALSSNNTTDVLRIINFGTGAGLHGLAGSGIGVFGESDTGPAVRGVSGPNGSEDGVRGIANGTGRGVSGFAGTGIGVQGNASGTGKGVEGLAMSGIAVNGQSQTGPGVRGTTAAGSADDGGRFLADKGRGAAGFSNTGYGVYGSGSAGIGVYGVSGGGSSPFGVVGTVTAAPGFGLFGIVNVAGAVGFAGGAGIAGAIAGQFSGPVNIYNSVPGANGDLYVQGNQTASGTKSAAVPHPDGSHRLLYCMEAPEAWFEDFGTGTITGGKAEVKLDPDFAAVVDTSTLHVFLTPHNGDHNLHVAGRSASGFTVGASTSAEAAARGAKATDASGTFTYRVVAKRKDVIAERLAKFTVPQEIKLAPPPVPSLPPEPPKKG